MPLRRLLGFALATLGAAALAQTPKLEPLPSEALACLGPADVEEAGPEYPFDDWKRDVGGRVKIEMRFTSPEAAPQVEVLEAEDSGGLVRAVRDHVRKLRVPCLGAGSQATLRREYLFKPGITRPVASETLDATALLHAELAKCMRHVEGEKHPEYPPNAQRQGLQGRVYAQVTFTDPASPPTVRLHARPEARLHLAPAVNRWLRDVRMPCLTGEKFVGAISFVFRFEDQRPYGLRPLNLAGLLPSVKGIRNTALKLDTRTMGCPFEAVWTYLRPELPNTVQLDGGITPARRPLVAFLRDIELELPERSLDSVFADRTTVLIPCVDIDLKPQG